MLKKIIYYSVIILWYALCVVSCCDTKLFVYQTLSNSLLTSSCCILMSVVLIIAVITNIYVYKLRWNQVMIVSWLLYIIIYCFISQRLECYLTMYLLCTLSLVASFSIAIDNIGTMVKHVENGIVLMMCIHIGYLILQNVGILYSGNPYFKITGADCNPNVTAITLAAGSNILVKKLINSKHVYIFMLISILCVYCIYVLKCRTAYLGIIVIGIYYFIGKNKFNGIKRKRLWIISFSFVFLLLFWLGYQWKKESADGRLFRWNRCCEMIVDNVCGYGYGLFERSYNAYQSDYFSKHEDERYSCSLQTASGSAYNDILEHTVQGGIFGGMFYLAFIVMIIISALRYSSKYEQSAILSLILMSLVNTIYCSISVWIIMIAFVVIITCNGPSLILSNYKKEIIANTSLCFFFVMLIKVFSMTYAQARFKILKDNGDRNMVSLNDLKNNISTSEAYYSYLAECYEYYNDNENAYNCYRKATDYSFAPMLLYREAKSAEKCNKNGEAIRILLIATNMLPGHMSLKYYLMCTYMSGHKCHEARNVAREILEKQCKNTENNEIIKQEAYAILNSNF